MGRRESTGSFVSINRRRRNVPDSQLIKYVFADIFRPSMWGEEVCSGKIAGNGQKYLLTSLSWMA